VGVSLNSGGEKSESATVLKKEPENSLKTNVAGMIGAKDAAVVWSNAGRGQIRDKE